MKTKTLTLWAVATAGMILFTGCASKTPARPKTGPPFSYLIQSDPNSLAGATFQVDVLKVNASTRSMIEGISVPEYFKLESPVRKSCPVIYSTRLTAGSSVTINLTNSEFQPIRYPNYTDIAFVAFPPGEVKVTPGPNGDPRIILLPLDPNKWPRKWPGKEREITVTITRSLGWQTDPGWISVGP